MANKGQENIRNIGAETRFKTGGEAAAAGRRGGQKSGIARRRKNASRAFLKEVLAMEGPMSPELKRACVQFGMSIGDDEKLTNEQIGVLALLKKYRSGDLRAFDMVHEYLGEDPHSVMEEKRLKLQQEAVSALKNTDGFIAALGGAAGEVFEDGGGDTPDAIEDTE